MVTRTQSSSARSRTINEELVSHTPPSIEQELSPRNETCESMNESDPLEHANSFMKQIFARMTPQQIQHFINRQRQVSSMLSSNTTEITDDVFNDYSRSYPTDLHLGMVQIQDISLPMPLRPPPNTSTESPRTPISAPRLTAAQKRKGRDPQPDEEQISEDHTLALRIAREQERLTDRESELRKREEAVILQQQRLESLLATAATNARQSATSSSTIPIPPNTAQETDEAQTNTQTEQHDDVPNVTPISSRIPQSSSLYTLLNNGVVSNNNELEITAEQLLRMKMQMQYDRPPVPPKYDGRAHFKTFTNWSITLADHIEDCHIPKENQVRQAKHYLTGKALDFYMKRVQRNEREWNLKTFLSELFDNCFPPDFRISYRRRLNESKQEGRNFETWYNELKDFAEIVGDIPNEQILLYLWGGADNEVAAKWAEQGYTPETSTIDKLVSTATAQEKANKLRNRFHTKPADSRYRTERSHRPPETNARKTYGTWRQNYRNDQVRTQSDRNGGREHSQHNTSRKRERDHHYTKHNHDQQDDKKRRKWSQDKMAEFKASGACYECGEKGHLGKDCPKRHHAKPPSHLIANAARLQELDKLTSKSRELAQNTSASINFCSTDFLSSKATQVNNSTDSEQSWSTENESNTLSDDDTRTLDEDDSDEERRKPDAHSTKQPCTSAKPGHNNTATPKQSRTYRTTCETETDESEYDEQIVSNLIQVQNNDSNESDDTMPELMHVSDSDLV